MGLAVCVGTLAIFSIALLALHLQQAHEFQGDPYANLYDGTLTVHFHEGRPISTARMRQIASSVGGTMVYFDVSSSAFPVMVIRLATNTSFTAAWNLAQQIQHEAEVESALPSPRLSEN